MKIQERFCGVVENPLSVHLVLVRLASTLVHALCKYLLKHLPFLTNTGPESGAAAFIRQKGTQIFSTQQ